jgi:undecaprenyl diphosphate synthase
MSDTGSLTLGIIMDGNRRWAKAKGMLSFSGHEAGFEKVKEVIEWGIEAKVSNIIFYAFSTENWKRSEEEVSYLMALIERGFRERIGDIVKLGVRVRVIGERERFSKNLQQIIFDVEEQSAVQKNITATFALSYGGRRDIVQAANTLIAQGAHEVTEDALRGALWGSDIPDPDLIIRPGGEKRLSNFLLWQGAYAELFFTDTFWPDFTKEEFSRILDEYHARERRRGK